MTGMVYVWGYFKSCPDGKPLPIGVKIHSQKLVDTCNYPRYMV